jgi:competence protein ComEA
MSIKDYFSFTKGEKRGVFVLLTIIVLVASSLHFIKYFRVIEQTDFSDFDEAITTFEKELIQQKLNDSIARITKNNIVLPSEFFEFNPNEMEDSNWLKLGFAEWQVRTINNYKSKGGEFRIKSDVSKIFGISDTLYKLIYPYILLPENIEKKVYEKNYANEFPKKNFEPYKKKEPIIVDINLCDTTQLQELKGIGSAYSKRIIKYRESLGGFISIHQLKEVYGITDEIFNQISPNLKISNTIINQIDINHVNEEQLKKHPYIGWKLAKPIIAYRKSHGKFAAVSDIKKIHLITDEIYSKIAPYLKAN